MRVILITLLALTSLAAGIGAHPQLSPSPQLPVRFEEGTSASGHPQFVVQAQTYSLTLDSPAARIAWRDRPDHPAGRVSLRWGNQDGRWSGEELLPVRTNRLIGDSQRWQREIRSYARVRRNGIAPGVDLVFHGSQGALEYDFVIAPGANPNLARLTIDGADRLRLHANGNLAIESQGQILLWNRPIAYQEIDGRRVAVASAFQLRKQVLSFAVGAYDRTRPLIIDPTLSLLSYFGGTGNEAGRVAVDISGNLYLAGVTTSSNLPVTGSAVQSTYRGATVNLLTGDAFVAKFSTTGALVYVTYLGGTGDDAAMGIAVDASGNAYVTGMTNSTDFPTTAGALQTKYAGAGGNTIVRQGDAFVAKLNAAGSQLVYSTYLGGSQDEVATAIAVDGSGAAYITGTTNSTNFPTTAGAYQTTLRGIGGQPILPCCEVQEFVGGDVFVSKLNAAGNQLVYSTYIGGGNADVATSIALDSAGNAYLGGHTISRNYPITTGAFQTTFRGVDRINEFYNLGDGFITKLNSTGTGLVFSTLIGASGDDVVNGVAVDGAGAVYATGSTTSANFPIVGASARTKFAGPFSIDLFTDITFGDAFALKLNPAGSGLVYSTYLGGDSDDMGLGIAVDSTGSVYIAGQTASANFPVTSDAAQPRFAGFGGQFVTQFIGDGWLTRLDPGGAITYSTYLGGTRDDALTSVALDRSGNAYVAGGSLAVNLPVTQGAFQSSPQGSNSSGVLRGDVFFAKFTGFAASGGTVLSAITNAASNATNAVAPGMIFVAYGAGLGPKQLASATVEGGVLQKTVSGTRILFDGIPAPLIYVSDAQASGIVPYRVGGQGSTSVVVEVNGLPSSAFTIPVAAASPALFSLNYSGTGQGAILNQDGKVNGADNPAEQGSILVLFGTGEGGTTPAGVDGQIASTVYPKPVLPVTVTIGGQNADVLYAGAAPQEVAGLLQINVRVPSGIASGNQPVVLTVGAFKSRDGLTAAIR